jgi:flagellar biogenesis protein FliO
MAQKTTQVTPKEENSQQRTNALIKFLVFGIVLLVIFIGGFLVQNLFKQNRKPAFQEPQKQRSVQDQKASSQAGLTWSCQSINRS